MHTNSEPIDRHTHTYEIELTFDDIDHKFTDDEKEILRPIAETIAMLDGNAFFDLVSDIYLSYLPEARALFRNNGGLTGWAGGASWIKDLQHETPAVADAYQHYKLLKNLSKEY